MGMKKIIQNTYYTYRGLIISPRPVPVDKENGVEGEQ